MRWLFEPRSIAVVTTHGAPSGDRGAAIVRNLRESFTGDLILVRLPTSSAPARDAAAVGGIPNGVDLVVAAVPSVQLLRVVDQCVAQQVRGLVAIADDGEPVDPLARGADVLRARVRQSGMGMVGPNSHGLLRMEPRRTVHAVASPSRPPLGSIAIAVQRGACGPAILDYLSERRLGLSSFVSLGDAVDISAIELLDYWADDPHTNVILLYLDAFGDPRRFGRLARHVARTKPIVAIRTSRQSGGARAAGSHTGSLAASESIVDDLFEQAGIVRVATIEEMCDVAALLAVQRAPDGPRVGIVTNAGGGALIADVAEGHGLIVPAVEPGTREALAHVALATCEKGNPVALPAAITEREYDAALSLMLADPAIDSVMAINARAPDRDAGVMAAAIAARAAQNGRKPIAAVFINEIRPPAELGHLACFRFPERAALALSRAAVYGSWRRRPRAAPLPPIHIDQPRVRAILGSALRRGGGWLTMEEAQGVLDACGVRVPAAGVVTTVGEAVRRATAIGFPVAVKAVGAGLLHKTPVGGVHLDLRDAQAVIDACRQLQLRLGDRLTGVFVQRMAASGLELLVGLADDATLGQILLCGPGGTPSALLGRAVARLLPVTDEDIDDLLRELPGSVLPAASGSTPIDEQALRTLLHRISSLTELCPEIAEMDLNPVRLHAAGLSVLDVRMRVSGASTATEHPRGD